jgi:hypothetical protein
MKTSWQILGSRSFPNGSRGAQPGAGERASGRAGERAPGRLAVFGSPPSCPGRHLSREFSPSWVCRGGARVCPDAQVRAGAPGGRRLWWIRAPWSIGWTGVPWIHRQARIDRAARRLPGMGERETHGRGQRGQAGRAVAAGARPGGVTGGAGGCTRGGCCCRGGRCRPRRRAWRSPPPRRCCEPGGYRRAARNQTRRRPG